MLKHVPEKVLKTFQNMLLYSKKVIMLQNNNGRREKNNNNLKRRSNNNINNIADRLTKFGGKIKKKMSLEYFFNFLWI